MVTGDLAARDDPVRSDRGDGLEIAVVGAGAVGATAAYDLARRGADVTVYDSGAVASGSSGRAAGVCYDAVATE
ncbi:MAG: sarcosine oxidase, partial [Halobacteriales archaeon SW_8_66_22]